MEGTIPSRVSRDEATSRGLRIGNTTRTSAPNSLLSLIQNSNRRQIRGSLSTKSRLSPYSSSSSICACSRNFPATGEAYQLVSKARQSSHPDPADSKMASFRHVMPEDSQSPRSFLEPGVLSAIFFGKSQPNRLSTRVVADVPLLCMPATRMATFVGRMLSASVDLEVSAIGICWHPNSLPFDEIYEALDVADDPFTAFDEITELTDEEPPVRTDEVRGCVEPCHIVESRARREFDLQCP